jgi:ribonuclease HI
VDFIKTWGDDSAIAGLTEDEINEPRFAVAKEGVEEEGQEDEGEGEDEDEDEDEVLQVVEKKPPAGKKGKKAEQQTTLVVYTDGSSLKNGRAGARAGVGVFFGVGDARNYSEPLAGDVQTNQRAELMGILQTLNTIPNTESVIIRSDSKYSINCATTWAKGWEDRAAKDGLGEWKTSENDIVKNQDLIKAIRAKMADREEVGTATTFEWVKGHSSDVGNAEADRLAKEGAKKARSR